MKKNALMIIAGVFLMAFATIGFAQTDQGQSGTREGGMMQGQGMMGQGMMGGDQGQGGMMGMMGGGCMMGKQIIATSDGGVVVFVGDTLYKYDKELNLKKEVEIPVDYEKMQKKMQKMHRMSPQDSGSAHHGGKTAK